LINFLALEVNGTTVTQFDGNEIDLGKWTRLSMREAIVKWWPEGLGIRPQAADFEDRDRFIRLFNQSAPDEMYIDSEKPLGRMIADAFEFLAERHLIQPTIIYDFPLAVLYWRV
jgi:lysyl-tRNA synthetase class 2